MTNIEKQKQGAELLNSLVEKAWIDNDFKGQLIENPTKTINDFTGKNFIMPVNKKIVVEDQSNESIIYLNIPAEPNLDELELSDEQLEQVAGGIIPAILAGIAVCQILYSAGTGIYDAINAN